MQKQVIGVSGMDHSQAEEVWRVLPPVIRKLTKKTDTFVELAMHICAVKHADLQYTYKGELWLQGLEEREKKRVAAPETPTRGTMRMFADMAFSGAAAQPHILSMYAALVQQQQQQPAYTPLQQAQIVPAPRAPRASGGFVFSEHLVQDQIERARAALGRSHLHLDAARC